MVREVVVAAQMLEKRRGDICVDQFCRVIREEGHVQLEGKNAKPRERVHNIIAHYDI